jgi:hypothetical protein
MVVFPLWAFLLCKMLTHYWCPITTYKAPSIYTLPQSAKFFCLGFKVALQNFDLKSQKGILYHIIPCFKRKSLNFWELFCHIFGHNFQFWGYFTIFFFNSYTKFLKTCDQSSNAIKLLLGWILIMLHNRTEGKKKKKKNQ